ncbi:MAG: hypothetical protein H6558_11770 [Lewinellaceae bacterium]|nr:hypothetical protein [Lewinellaceae bacterium]MCB9288402.1 hypothetical protein [Lewinellaceae bacterium]
MNSTFTTPAILTLFLGLVLSTAFPGNANLPKYLGNNKIISAQFESGLIPGDTIPPKEQENFDRPFGSSDYQYKPYAPDPFAENKEAPPKVLQDQKVETGDFKPRLYRVPESYSGFKIEIKKVPKPLTASNDIFFQHGKLFAEKLQDGNISYMVGDFPSEEEASVFLSDFLAQRYPDARVVRYDQGERAN